MKRERMKRERMKRGRMSEDEGREGEGDKNMESLLGNTEIMRGRINLCDGRGERDGRRLSRRWRRRRRRRCWISARW